MTDRNSLFGLGFTAIGLLVVTTLMPGCTRPPAKLQPTVSAGRKVEEDPLQAALETLRNTRTAAGFRQALRPIDTYLQRPEERSKVQSDPVERALLEKHFRLDKEEMRQVEANYFQSLDAYYLEECFLLHDVFRAIEQPGVSMLQQAELCLEWTARQAVLRERADALVPPQFVLRQGHGTARERALVFLGLLQQMQVPACVLAWPETTPGGPRTVLVGVAGGKDTQLYLFDPRRARALPGPGGKGIATLRQLRKQPSLFPVSKEDEGKRPEVLLACSLTALAPRMLYLDKRLEGTDRVVLAVEPAKLLEQIREATGEEVGVWNPPAERDPAACDSPLRMLSHFMPAVEGGMDTTFRLTRLEQESIYWPKVVRRLVSMRLLGDAQFLAPSAQEHLRAIAEQIFKPYTRDTRDFIVRGQYERATRRLDMIVSAYDDLEFASLGDKRFQQEVNDWVRLAHDAYLALAKRLPRAQDMVSAFWSQDQYLFTLIEAQEKANPQKQQKTILAVLLLTALKDSLGRQAHFLEAQAWQERAERNEVSWKNPDKGSTAKAPRTEESVRQAWENAAGLWRKSVERYSVDWADFSGNLKQMQLMLKSEDFGQLMVMWRELLEDVDRTAVVRLNLARALEHSGNKAEALRRLTDLDHNLASFRSSPLLREQLQEFARRTRAAGNRAGIPFLESLTRELGPQGGLQTFADTVHEQLRVLKNR